MSFKTLRGKLGVAALLGSMLLGPAPRASDRVTIEAISKSEVPRASSGGDSSGIELSADGSVAVFSSDGNALATNDHNGLHLDVFLRDLKTSQIILLSRATNGAAAAGNSYTAAVSADGNSVVFESDAPDLVPGDRNDSTDLFLYDRGTGGLSMLTQNEEHGISGGSTLLAMTGDARFIVFESDADDYLADDTNDAADIFLLDRTSGNIELLTAAYNGGVAAVPPGADSSQAVISADGRFVAFTSAARNIDPTVARSFTVLPQLYLWDRTTGTNRWIAEGTNQSNRRITDVSRSSSRDPVMSANGEYLAFIGDGYPLRLPAQNRLYVYHRPTAEFIQVATPTLSEGIPLFDQPAMSADGRLLAYTYNMQVWVYDLAKRTNRLVSQASGLQANASAASPLISADGRTIVFESFASNLVTNQIFGVYQLFAFDTQSAEVRLLSQSGGSAGNSDVSFAAFSADGTAAGFMSRASNFSTSDNSRATDVFVVAASGAEPVRLVSEGLPSLAGETGGAASTLAGNALSLDGRYLAFKSEASDLTPGDTNGAADIFLRDRATGETKLLPRPFVSGVGAAQLELHGISDNGHTVLFSSLEWDGAKNASRVLAYDTLAGETRPANLLPDGTVTAARSGSMTADGRYAAFVATPENRVYVRDLRAGTSQLATGLIEAADESALISPGGRYLVLYRGLARNGRITGLFDRQTGSVRFLPSNSALAAVRPFSADDQRLLVNRFGPESHLYLFSTATLSSNLLSAKYRDSAAIDAGGSVVIFNELADPPASPAAMVYLTATGESAPLRFGTNEIELRGPPAFTPDGRFAALVIANDLEAVDSGFSDVYLFDRVLTNLTLLSRAIDGGPGDAPANSPAISANGQVVAFDSIASNLTPNDRNFASDIFLARLAPVDANQNGIEDGWEIGHFAGLADAAADPDQDGVSNLDEFRAGTDPHSALSRFALATALDGAGGTLTLSWPAAVGKTYRLQQRAAFAAGGWADTGNPETALADGTLRFTVPAAASAAFYRIRLAE